MLLDGEFYTGLTTTRGDTSELKACAEETVTKILANDTSFNRPGMLLGKIQSGKTRAYIGAIALAFDNGYDMAIILTKGTIALAQQTYARLKKDFSQFIDEDKLQIYDILSIPANLPRYVLRQKLIMVVKKQADNLERIFRALEETYPDLSKRKVLVIDDEADYASIGFRKKREEDIVQLNKIASQIDELRKRVSTSTFLQVTATPYSLYLQPEDLVIPETSEVFMPIRPAFTVLLPTYPGYIGGGFYFEESKDENTISSYIYEEVSLDELEILRREDKRSFKIEDVVDSGRVKVLRKGIMNFIVGACIRRIQQKKSGEREQKYSFVVHTEYGKASHTWQERVVIKLKEGLIESAVQNREIINQLIKDSYEDLACSLQFTNSTIPKYEEVRHEVIHALKDDYLIINKVNSENDIMQILGENGQLRMVTPLNIFIGGQILDRGLTIDNLIGFYYGRRPNKFQQDTVLQHSRMFGNRTKEDLAVTRFYTAQNIYEVMKRINEFDTALRDAFEKGAQDAGVVFIHKDPANMIKPCSPNKILLSTVTTLKPFKRMLPIGFQTNYKTKVKYSLEELDRKIQQCELTPNTDRPFLIDLNVAQWIVDDIHKLLIFEDGYEWDIKAFKASMEYLSRNTDDLAHRGKVWCIVRRNRNVSRKKGDGRFSDAPDTPKTEGALAKETAIDIPMLMLFRQNGKEEQGWRGSSFWWPVLEAPQNTRTVIYASDLIEDASEESNT